MNQKNILLLFTLGIFVFVFGLGAYLVNTGMLQIGVKNTYTLNQNLGNEKAYQKDLEKLSEVPNNFGALTEYFIALSENEGALYAYEVLKRAQLPPNTDLHLLGHTVGNELYKQEGFDGMQYCTPDFRNACSHTIVIGGMLEEGMGVFDRVHNICKQAPGGPGAYTMCFHGFGHGVLAYVDYEMADVAELCERVGTEEYSNNEFHQCIGGAVMEMYQGVHDLELWDSVKGKYLDPEDPLKMCQSDYMPDEAKYFCYTYITPFIFDAAGAVGGNPTPDIYEKAFSYCEDVPEPNLRLVCYGGFGKEFVVLAQDRDIRNMDETDEEELKNVIQWCQLAKVEDGIEACLLEVQNSLYWGGENGYESSIRYCSLMPTDKLQTSCFSHMFGNVSFYERNQSTKEDICKAVPEIYRDTCTMRLLSDA